ncbi:MAG: hypothetical protein QME81_02440 [bacterium]|nr:hypothetical protein [bacterium]
MEMIVKDRPISPKEVVDTSIKGNRSLPPLVQPQRGGIFIDLGQINQRSSVGAIYSQQHIPPLWGLICGVDSRL